MNKSKHSEHRGVFDQQMYDFFENDIESCLLVSKIKQFSTTNLNFPGGTNFTAALTILSVVEMMAAYYSGIVEKSGRLHPANPLEVGKFLQKYFSKYDPRFQNVKFGENFYKVFRHGLSHQFSPKRAGIDMNFQSTNILTFNSGKIPFLNVTAFFNITKQALRDYDQDLRSGHGIEEFVKHFEAINKTDDKDMEEFKKYLNISK